MLASTAQAAGAGHAPAVGPDPAAGGAVGNASVLPPAKAAPSQPAARLQVGEACREGMEAPWVHLPAWFDITALLRMHVCLPAAVLSGRRCVTWNVPVERPPRCSCTLQHAAYTQDDSAFDFFGALSGHSAPVLPHTPDLATPRMGALAVPPVSGPGWGDGPLLCTSCFPVGRRLQLCANVGAGLPRICSEGGALPLEGSRRTTSARVPCPAPALGSRYPPCTLPQSSPACPLELAAIAAHAHARPPTPPPPPSLRRRP